MQGLLRSKTIIIVLSLSVLSTLGIFITLFYGPEFNVDDATRYFKTVISSTILDNPEEEAAAPTELHSISALFNSSLTKLITNINETIPAEELVDLSPSKDPWTESDLEPYSVKPLVREGQVRRVRAAFISLVRNEEARSIVSSMRQIESKFNRKFNYPWIFFNDEPFTPEFKELTSKAASQSQCSYIQLKPEDWEEPSWIDRNKAAKLGEEMEEKSHVQYATKQSYHRMCRWNSGIFFKNPALRDYDWYWRVEPKTKYFCDIDYDVFAYMEDNDKDYGFTLNLYDSPQSVANLWPTTMEFFEKHPEYVHPNSSRAWLLQDSRSGHNQITGGYSTCHFWSNFEIGRLDFFRSKEYTEYFDYLDKAGGFFYERWGDAPVHSIGLGLLTDKSRIHFFKDIGYNHIPYFNCHASPKCSGCKPGVFAEVNDLQKENCIKEWFKVAGDG